jgi:hypothetical protein
VSREGLSNRIGALVFVLPFAAVSSACVQSSATSCANLLCPTGTTCVASAQSCVDDDLLRACEGKEQGETCFVAGAPDGVCRDGVCTTGNCGDGAIDGVEQCDGSDIGTLTCLNFGFNEPGNLTCKSDCRYDTTECTGLCGDGERNGLEFCEGSDLGGKTCLDMGFYAKPGLSCADNCTLDSSQCGGGRCGDGIRNGLERCDGVSMTASCSSLGYPGAQTALSCNANCTFDPAVSCLCAALRCNAFTQTCACNKTGSCGCQALQ